MKFTGKILATIALVVLGSTTAQAGLIINPIWDSSVTSRGDSVQIQAAFNWAASQYSTLYTDDITLYIRVTESSSIGLGQSASNLVGIFSYSTIRGALTADAETPDDFASTGTLGASDPTSGGSFITTRAHAKALGLLDPHSVALDGTFFFSSNATYALDPNNRKVAGQYDFAGLALHEISEVMGRIPGLKQPTLPFYMPFDLYRYTSLNSQSLTHNATGVYFSIDSGATNLKNFNSDPVADLAGWANGDPNDPYNSFANTNSQWDLTEVDMRVMDVIGYDRVILNQEPVVTPEPSQVLPLVLSLGAIGFGMRRRKRS